MPDDQKPGQADPKQGGQPTPQPDDDDLVAAEIAKNPEAVKALLKQKRTANEEAKQTRLKLEKFEKEQEEAKNKALEEQGKFKELADKERQEKETLKANSRNQAITFALKIEAVRAGITDPEDIALIDRSAVKVSDDLNEVTGAKEAVEVLKAKKPYLFSKPQGGGEPAPGNPKPSYMRGGGGTAEGLTPEQRIAKGLAESKPPKS